MEKIKAMLSGLKRVGLVGALALVSILVVLNLVSGLMPDSSVVNYNKTYALVALAIGPEGLTPASRPFQITHASLKDSVICFTDVDSRRRSCMKLEMFHLMETKRLTE